MRHRNEFNARFNDFIYVKIKALDERVRHYHADGGVELIRKEILGGVKEDREHIFMEPKRHS